jgi:hypothetical protein
MFHGPRAPKAGTRAFLLPPLPPSPLPRSTPPLPQRHRCPPRQHRQHRRCRCCRHVQVKHELATFGAVQTAAVRAEQEAAAAPQQQLPPPPPPLPAPRGLQPHELQVW